MSKTVGGLGNAQGKKVGRRSSLLADKAQDLEAMEAPQLKKWQPKGRSNRTCKCQVSNFKILLLSLMKLMMIS
jgi:hypothetical protein